MRRPMATLPAAPLMGRERPDIVSGIDLAHWLLRQELLTFLGVAFFLAPGGRQRELEDIANGLYVMHVEVFELLRGQVLVNVHLVLGRKDDVAHAGSFGGQ